MQTITQTCSSPTALAERGRGIPKQKIPTAKIDADWHNHLAKSAWWCSENIMDFERFYKDFLSLEKRLKGDKENEYRALHGKYVKLHNLLLSIGGEETCFAYIEEDLEKILRKGKYFSGQSKMMRGKPSRCHANVATLWERNKTDHDVRICTGYALSPDGMWRQHSWLVHYYQTATQNRRRLIETTEKRVAYFGFEMSNAEAKHFSVNNY